MGLSPSRPLRLPVAFPVCPAYFWAGGSVVKWTVCRKTTLALPPARFPTHSATWNCMVRASATRFEASRISMPSRLPSAS
jgi:hypothetical protein